MTFLELEQYVAIPRVSGLVVSPDGSRVVVSVATLDAKATKFVTALWEVDPTGEKPARRLTRSAKGEASAAFTQDGDLLFTCARPDPDGKEDDDEPVPALWLLPRDGGEARVVADRGGGAGGVQVARRRRTSCCVGSDVLPQRDGRRDRRGAAQGAQGEEGLGDPARRLPGPVLGPRPRSGRRRTCSSRRSLRTSSRRWPERRTRASRSTDLTPGAGSALGEQAAATQPGRRARS